MTETYNVVGLMSGTSTDGLDLCAIVFSKVEKQWHYEIVGFQTIAFPAALSNKLRTALNASGVELASLHTTFGRWCGEQVRAFCLALNFDPLLVASHGHSVFHEPKQGYTYQIGCGATMAVSSGYKVVCDFRTADVALGGQGAPLVPMGDALLFQAFDACLNLGGFANISILNAKQPLAFDVTVCNLALNEIVAPLAIDFDRGGAIALTGSIHKPALDALNKLPFMQIAGPKSLGKEWYEQAFKPCLALFDFKTIADCLATVVEHISSQIGLFLSHFDSQHKLLVTGGGAYNQAIIKAIRRHTKAAVHIPDAGIIEGKEALIFGLLGLLRYLQLPNTMPSATGAVRSISAGALYLP